MGDTTYYTFMPSPVGEIKLVSHGEGLAGLYTERHRIGAVQESWVRDAGPFREAEAQLAAYFAGEVRTFDLPLDPRGTEFQRVVWAALLEIPFGERISYGELARRIGRPSSSRAVGHANGRNPISIIVPCHRVVGSAGALTGYGGGLDCKRWLLDHEAEFSGTTLAGLRAG